MKNSTRINPPPTMCAAHHPTTGKPIIIIRGQSGYHEIKTNLPSEIAVEVFNRPLGITPEQVEAMLAGSMFGWTCPAANPKPSTH